MVSQLSLGSETRLTTSVVVDLFDYAFAENGLTAYRESIQLSSESFISWIGEEEYKKLVKFILHYIADLDIPLKRLASLLERKESILMSLVVHLSNFAMA